jgi:hypothetical protein
VPVIGILIVLPASAITNFSGFVSAIQTVFTVYGGTVTAAGTATLSGIVAAIVVVLAQQITSGDAAKYFNAVLGVTISTTLISYLLIYPAARGSAATSSPRTGPTPTGTPTCGLSSSPCWPSSSSGCSSGGWADGPGPRSSGRPRPGAAVR